MPPDTLSSSTQTTSHPSPPKEESPLRIRNLSFGSLSILNADIEYRDLRKGPKQAYLINGIIFQTQNFRVDLENYSARSLLQEELQLSVNRLRYLFDEESMLFEVDSLQLNTRQERFSLSALRLSPQYSKEQFAQLSPKHTDWTKVTCGAIQAYGVDFLALLEKKQFQIDSLSIAKSWIGSFKNRKIPQQERIKPLFSQTLQRLPIKTHIRKIQLNHLDACYEELSIRGRSPGRITFDSIYAEVYGLTNITNQKEMYYRLKAQGKLMNRGVVNTVILLPIDSTTNRFEVTGTLGALTMEALNPAIEPLASTRIMTGNLRQMKFQVVGDTLRSHCELTLSYDSLQVEILRDRRRGYTERRLLTEIIDELLILHSNPLQGRLRSGKGTLKRDLYKSQFNYLWKSLLPGIKQTVLNEELIQRYLPHHKKPQTKAKTNRPEERV